MAATSSAKRCLFGKASAKSTQAFCSRVMAEYHEQKKRQYGFDFHTGVPVPSSSTSTFIYTKLASDAVPGFYRASVLDRTANCLPDAENNDPAPVNVSLDSSMECEENLASPKIAARTPKKKRSIYSLRTCKTNSIAKKSVNSTLLRQTPHASYTVSK